MPTNAELLTEQHRQIDQGIVGLVDGSGSRAEFTEAIYLLRKHIYVEEALLFPVIYEDEGRHMALAQMKHEHGDMWPHIEHLVELIENKAFLEDMLADAEALIEMQQIHDPKEEEAIYSVAERYQPTGDQPTLEAAFADTDIPEGWRCQEAP